jgi:hypothetical protein
VPQVLLENNREPRQPPPFPADFDGDGKADPTVSREAEGGNSRWHINKSDSNYTSSIAVQWETTDDIPVPGYYDYDAIADVALYRPSTGEWYISRSSSGFTTSFGLWWGLPGDVPVPADYDGDGTADPTIYRPATGQWLILRSTCNYSAFSSLIWGSQAAGDVPVRER